jgi:hypothetical protein
MKDRELMELAAKGGGLGDLYQWDEESECIKYPYRSELTDGHLWNPLTDDGDALRLAVKTGRTDLSLLVGRLALVDECKGLTGAALVRRAIVWDVASEVGRGK